MIQLKLFLGLFSFSNAIQHVLGGGGKHAHPLFEYSLPYVPDERYSDTVVVKTTGPKYYEPNDDERLTLRHKHHKSAVLESAGPVLTSDLGLAEDYINRPTLDKRDYFAEWSVNHGLNGNPLTLDGGCVGEEVRVPGPVLQCPRGYTLLQETNMCALEDFKWPSEICPLGTIRGGSSSSCLQIDTVAPSRVCPAGFDYFLKSCIRRSYKDPVFSCGSEGSLEYIDGRYVCLKEQAHKARAVCPAEYSWYGEINLENGKMTPQCMGSVVQDPDAFQCPIAVDDFGNSVEVHLRDGQCIGIQRGSSDSFAQEIPIDMACSFGELTYMGSNSFEGSGSGVDITSHTYNNWRCVVNSNSTSITNIIPTSHHSKHVPRHSHKHRLLREVAPRKAHTHKALPINEIIVEPPCTEAPGSSHTLPVLLYPHPKCQVKWVPGEVGSDSRPRPICVMPPQERCNRPIGDVRTTGALMTMPTSHSNVNSVSASGSSDDGENGRSGCDVETNLGPPVAVCTEGFADGRGVHTNCVQKRVMNGEFLCKTGSAPFPSASGEMMCPIVTKIDAFHVCPKGYTMQTSTKPKHAVPHYLATRHSGIPTYTSIDRCELIEMTDFQSTCPDGYERRADKPCNKHDTCIAEKEIVASLTCDPGYLLVDCHNGRALEELEDGDLSDLTKASDSEGSTDSGDREAKAENVIPKEFATQPRMDIPQRTPLIPPCFNGKTCKRTRYVSPSIAEHPLSPFDNPYDATTNVTVCDQNSTASGLTCGLEHKYHGIYEDFNHGVAVTHHHQKKYEKNNHIKSMKSSPVNIMNGV